MRDGDAEAVAIPGSVHTPLYEAVNEDQLVISYLLGRRLLAVSAAARTW
jgi:hypothetical protein